MPQTLWNVRNSRDKVGEMKSNTVLGNIDGIGYEDISKKF